MSLYAYFEPACLGAFAGAREKFLCATKIPLATVKVKVPERQSQSIFYWEPDSFLGNKELLLHAMPILSV